MCGEISYENQIDIKVVTEYSWMQIMIKFICMKQKDIPNPVCVNKSVVKCGTSLKLCKSAH